MAAQKKGTQDPKPSNPGLDPITAEQAARGVAGEEEILRRLRLPGGWDGFVFVRDTRAGRCGFDFEASFGERLVALEIKTFTHDGRVILTSRELQAAAERKTDYFLIGIQDSDEELPPRWKSFQICNPLLRLMTMGEFVLDAKLQVQADMLFEFKQESAKDLH